jgi:hypothetical protein
MDIEAFQRTVALMTMAATMARQGLRVEFLTVGTGIEVYRNNTGSAPQFEALLKSMQAAGITLAACTNSMKAMGVAKEDMFPVDKFVIGGDEVAARVKENYRVMTW